MALQVGLALLALAGHCVLWVAVVNRIHGTGMRRARGKAASLVSYGCFLVLGLWAAWELVRAWDRGFAFSEIGPSGVNSAGVLLMCYVAACAIIALVHFPRWVWRRFWRATPVLLSQKSATVNIGNKLRRNLVRGRWATALSHVPGNQLLRLSVEELVLSVPRLAPALDGLSIAHLSDLHYSGRVDRAYFEEVAVLSDRLEADLIVLTGDICDSARCIDWIPETLGRVQSRYGKFYVLGNHDLRTRDLPRLCRTMAAAGWTRLNARWQAVDVGGQAVLFAGSELPWISGADEPRDLCDRSPPGRGLRICLAHTPDQLTWARSMDCDLMLAGHTHAGQIRVPWIGPIACPSWYGIKYSDGVFHEPPTILRVSRGISSLLPLRLFCQPEITKLVLRCDQGAST